MDLIGPVLEQALDVAVAALDPPPARACLYPGAEVAWDDCDCGQAWVRLVLVEPWFGDGNRQRVSAYGPCGPLKWAVTLGVGVLRCAATVDDSGHAPEPSVLTSETLAMTRDMTDLSKAITCDFPTVRGLDRVQVTRWEPLGPDGLCAGGEWIVTALVDACKCEGDGQ